MDLSQKILRCNIFLKIQNLDLDFFSENLGAINDKQGERFQQNIYLI